MNGNVEVKNGDLDLFYSNSLLVDASNPTTLYLAGDANESILEFIFSFENDDKNKSKPARKFNVLGDTKMEVIFINFNNVLGTYSSDIWELGILKHRKLYMYYHVRDFSNSEMKQFDFTFYLGEEVVNG